MFNFLRVSLVALMLIIATSSLAAHEKCEVELKPLQGIYYRYCPPGAVSTANATLVRVLNGHVWVQDQLKCAELKVVCDRPAKKVDSEHDLEDN